MEKNMKIEQNILGGLINLEQKIKDKLSNDQLLTGSESSLCLEIAYKINNINRILSYIKKEDDE